MKSAVYFKNLNALRFIAAFLVIIHHIEQFKSSYEMPNYWGNPFIKEVGHLGVVLFFVLSGFLITYLLLKEKEETQTISIRSFYIRRILRIWPLYYLIVIIGFFVLTQISLFDVKNYSEQVKEGFGWKLLLFILFLPNLAGCLYLPVPYVSQAWSVGVEEQFYLIWPLLVKKFKNTFFMLSAVIIFYLGAKFLLTHFHIRNPDSRALTVLSGFWNLFSIDCMAIGGIAAYLLFHKNDRILSVVFNRFFQILVYALTIFLILIGKSIWFFNNELYSVLFAMIILNLAGNKKSIINMEFKPLNYLGKISYGLYMYHSICIIAGLQLCNYLGIDNAVFVYLTCLLFSIIISAFSFEFIENRFIRLKGKYSKVLSGSEAKETMQAGNQLL